MGCGGSAVMDLEPIEERANEFATWVGKFDSAERVYAAFASAADVPALRAEVERLRAEVARLTTRPAPAWDEEAVYDEAQTAAARVVAPYTSGPMDPLDVQVTDAILAVVRDHLPVKPSREDVYRAWHGTDDPWGGCADSASIERVLALLHDEPGPDVDHPTADALVARFTITPKEDR